MAVKMAITHQLLHLNKQVTYVQTEILVCWFLSGYKIGGRSDLRRWQQQQG